MSGTEDDIAAQIAGWRDYLGWTKAELARRVEVSPEAVLQWEDGSTRPTEENQGRIVRAFGLTRAQFWGPIPTKPRATA